MENIMTLITHNPQKSLDLLTQETPQETATSNAAAAAAAAAPPEANSMRITTT